MQNWSKIHGLTPTNLLSASALTLGICLSTPLLSLAADPVELGNGQTFFLRSPLLIRSATSFRSPAVLANYYFTITIPSGAGAPLKTVTITQQPNLETIVFYPSQFSAFLGDGYSGQPIPLVPMPDGPKTGEVKVVFEKSVEPGNTVTISLRVSNPLYGGIYQFGVRGFPPGENSQGLYLGTGRIQLTTPGPQ